MILVIDVNNLFFDSSSGFSIWIGLDWISDEKRREKNNELKLSLKLRVCHVKDIRPLSYEYPIFS
jgi:hypothetical protein